MVTVPLKLKKNLDAMETDVAHSRQDQEGSKNAASNGPDINKLARDFSSGVKFSPRVKHMMEQSKIEIAAFINSLAPSAVTVEELLDVAAATTNAAQAPCAASAAGAEIRIAATQPAAVEVQAVFGSDSAARAECIAAAKPAAVEVQTVFGAESTAGADHPAATPRTTSATSFSATPSAAVAAVMTMTPIPPAAFDAAVDSDMDGSMAEGAMHATPTKNSFRASTECSGMFLRGQKMPASPLFVAKRAALLSPSKRDDGCVSSKTSENTPARCEKSASLGKGAPRIAMVPFLPSTPSSKSRRIEDVIAFGGISEKIASPVRSS
jgi:hypothetical protein